MNDIQKLRHDLEELKDKYGKCTEMFCSTCGGYGHHIFQVLAPESRAIIESTLERATSTEFQLLNEWQGLIKGRFPNQVEHISVRESRKVVEESKNIDRNDPEELNTFICKVRDLKKTHEGAMSTYESVLRQAFEIAKKTKYISLIEALIITCKKEVLEDISFLKLVIEVSEEHPESHEVVHDFLREEKVWIEMFLMKHGVRE